MFHDRIEAGLQLAGKLEKYKNVEAVVMAIPRGGVPVAYAVAKELGLPVEVILTKKIGHPMNKEYAIGAASLTDFFIIPHEDVTEAYIEKELQRVRNRLREMYTTFMGDKEPGNLDGKIVIVIDDGIATGNTLLSTINVLRKSNPRKIVIGAPVASNGAIQKLTKVVDEVAVVLVPEEFYGVGAFYENFKQVSNIEVIYYLDKIKGLKRAG